MRKYAILVASLFFLSASSAFATSVSFNFLDQQLFGSAYGQTSFSTTVDGLDVLIEAFGDNATIYWDGTDGLGVQSDSYEDDEIEGNESLRISFSHPVFVTGLFFTDFFNEPNAFNNNYYLETGWYQLGGNNPSAFTADPLQFPTPASNGELALFDIPYVLADEVTFTAPGYMRDGERHEFSLARIDTDVAAAPEPGTLALLGSGLASMGFLRRRKQLSGKTV